MGLHVNSAICVAMRSMQPCFRYKKHKIKKKKNTGGYSAKCNMCMQFFSP